VPQKEPVAAGPPKAAPRLKLKEKKVPIKLDVYSAKFKKLFESDCPIAADDLPFGVDSTAEQIVETILCSASDLKDAAVKSRLRDALRKWHPDKFGQVPIL
jgi:hypothetical protein